MLLVLFHECNMNILAAEGVDSIRTEVLPDRTQPGCYWEEGSSYQQDFNSHGQITSGKVYDSPMKSLLDSKIGSCSFPLNFYGRNLCRHALEEEF